MSQKTKKQKIDVWDFCLSYLNDDRSNVKEVIERFCKMGNVPQESRQALHKQAQAWADKANKAEQDMNELTVTRIKKAIKDIIVTSTMVKLPVSKQKQLMEDSDSDPVETENLLLAHLGTTAMKTKTDKILKILGI